MVATCGRPVGGIQQQIRAAGIAAPHRETQVVADQRTHPPALHFQHHLLLAGTVVLVLTGHAEQVTLVIVRQRTVRARPEQAVAVAAISGLDDQAAADHRAQVLSLLAQPLAGRAILGLGQGG